MASSAIRIENLGKSYKLAHQGGERPAYRTLRESLTGGVATLANRVRGKLDRQTSEEFWALKDVSFDVQPGEVVGIIGRNGAGKSTLLKILSQITKPSTGRIVINGRVASLLEVGTGFHPELTGRENVYLNGSILGMSRKEIARKFDEIVDFAEVEKFLDTPVKRYSSGMYVRLAFAVAAHLEPEILIVDEVLAVGDAQFQKKCLGKMGDVGKSGRTVLFVSHNMAALQHLCKRAVLLEKGSEVANGPVGAVIREYLQRQTDESVFSLAEMDNRTGTGDLRFTYFRVEDAEGRAIQSAHSGQEITLVFGYKCNQNTIRKSVNVGYGLHAPTGERLVILYASHTGEEFHQIESDGEFRCRIPRLPLNPGRIFVYPRIEVNGIEADFPRNGAGYFDIIAGDYYGTGRQTVDQSYSPFLIDANWTNRSCS